MEKEMIMSCAKMKCELISIQPTITIKNDVRYLRSVNIYLGKKILKKIYLDEPLQLYSKSSAINIVQDFLSEKFNPSNESNKNSEKSKQSYRKNSKSYSKTRNNAAKEFLANLNI